MSDAASKGAVVKVRIAHSSMQFSDSPAQWRHDANRVLGQNYDWITGTEAGELSNWKELRQAALRNGYLIRKSRGNWIAVKKSIVKRGSVRWGTKLIARSDEVAGAGHDTVLHWIRFTHKNPVAGKISVIGSHYPTKGRPGTNGIFRRNLRWTRRAAQMISAKAIKLGRGSPIVFYGGDQNIVDKRADTFFGGPLTSCWDELKTWPNTGHGNIDVIASYDGDSQVKAVRARALDDGALFLYSDHYLIEAVYEIRRTSPYLAKRR